MQEIRKNLDDERNIKANETKEKQKMKALF